jgi:uncharacterized protein
VKAMRFLMMLCVALVLAGRASAEELRSTISFGGSDAGENVFEMTSDGNFISKTDLEIAGIKISSALTGKFEGDKLVSYTLVQKRGDAENKVEWANGKTKVTAMGKTTERDAKFEKGPVFANFHTQVFRTLPAAMEGKSGAQTLESLILDGGAVVKITVTPKASRTVKSGTGNILAQEYSVKIGDVEALIMLDDEKRVLGMDVPAQRFQVNLKGFSEVFVDPVSKYPELSPPTLKSKRTDNVKMRMRDGVELAADIIAPETEGKYPTILVRTPYGRKASAAEGEWWAKRGYVYIAQDCRGRGDSDGAWQPFVNERKDGYDTLDWVAKQPWSDGKVGMIGGSYLGYVQWAAAVEKHPALKCIIPQVSPPDFFYNLPYDYGTFFLWGSLWWANIVKTKNADMSLAAPAMKNAAKLTMLPLSKLDEEIMGATIPFYDEWLAKDRPSAFSDANYASELPKVTIPAMHISGWWDGDGIGTKRNWSIMRAAKRDNQWLLYGPWSHAFNSSSKFGDVDYGDSAILELQSVYLRWFDTWLKGKDVNLDAVPKVKVFVTGVNEWRELRDWPDPRSPEKVLYLAAENPANGMHSQGKLLEAPLAECEPSRYTYNPANAVVPKEILEGKADEASTVAKIERHDEDTLIYKTEPLKEVIEMGGPIQLDLHFSTSAKDTDFFFSVVDVAPDGKMRIIGMPGKIGGKFVAGWKEPKLLTPGKTYRVTLEHWDTAHCFKPGHRIGVMITSSMFPLYARNLNTGEPIKDATRIVTAHQTVYHDKMRPSALRFRVLPAKPTSAEAK